MSKLFKRAWKVVIDKLDVSALHIEFKVLRTLKPEPNKGVIKVINLSQDHRSALLKLNNPNPGKKLVGVSVKLEAGYEGNTCAIYQADMREVTSQRVGVDGETTLAGDDGGRSWREARIKKQFTRGTPIGEVLKQCADAMGIGLGNSSDFDTSVQIQGMGLNLPHNMTLDGSASSQLDRLVSSCDLTWSIQNGVLQVLPKGQPLQMGSLFISDSTGLIGSPQASIDSTVSLGNPQQYAPGAKNNSPKPTKPKDPSILRLKTLLIPGLIPGRKIDLKSESFDGGYVLTECEYVGQSWGQDWYVNSIARKYS